MLPRAQAHDAACRNLKLDLESLRLKGRGQHEELKIAKVRCGVVEGQLKESRVERERERESGREWERRCEEAERQVLDERARADNAREGWERAKEALRVAAEEAEGLREVGEGERGETKGLRKVADELADDLLEATAAAERESGRADKAERLLEETIKKWREERRVTSVTMGEQKHEVEKLREEAVKATMKANDMIVAAEDARDEVAADKEKMMVTMPSAKCIFPSPQPLADLSSPPYVIAWAKDC